jgi:small-conductance mechanosensitive channel
MLVAGAIQNFSLTDSKMRLAAHVSVSYQTDIEKILGLLEEAAASVMRVSKNPAPQAMLVKFGADGLDLEVGFWISDPESGRTNVLSDVNRAIWRTLQDHQVEIPYPQREVRLIGDLK